MADRIPLRPITRPVPTAALTISVRWARDRRREASRQDRLREAVTSIATLGLGLVLIVASVLILNSGRIPLTTTINGLTAGAEAAPPRDLMAAAAGELERVTRPAGSGYRFEILQTSTMRRIAGGPQIPIPDPANPRQTLRFADEYYLNALLERGVARPDGFWSQMRAGPAEGQVADWASPPTLFEALVRDGLRWRNDGDGWYQADVVPGIGLDPETAALLPALLRAAVDPRDEVGDPDPSAARTLRAEATPAQIPGVVAVGGRAFTDLIAPVSYGFDQAGRLVSISVVARNTNMTDFDLVVETTIRIAYDGVDPLPEPRPAAEGMQP